MAANRFGIDVGQLYRDQENIKGARTRNKMASLQLGEAEREIEQRPIREEATKKRNNMLTDLRQKAVSGDDDASRKYLAVGGDPSFLEAVGKMDDRQLEESKNAIDEKGRMLATVRNAAPERQEGLYQQMLSMLPDDSKANMPQNYDPNFVDLSLSKMIAMDKILENPKVVRVGGEDVTYQRGREIGREQTAAKAPLVSVSTGGDKKESEKLAELRVKRLDEIQQKAIQAEESIESINQIRAIDLDTGLGVETRGQIAKVWDAMGGNGKELTGVNPSDVQKFKAVATKQVLDIMASQKGPQTDQDAARIEKAVANLGNTKEANQFVMDAAIGIANRKIEQSAFYENFLEENDTVKGADSAWRDFKSKTPMVSDVVKDPVSGNPLFYYQFKTMMMNKQNKQGQQFTQDDINEAWRRMNIGAK